MLDHVLMAGAIFTMIPLFMLAQQTEEKTVFHTNTIEPLGNTHTEYLQVVKVVANLRDLKHLECSFVTDNARN